MNDDTKSQIAFEQCGLGSVLKHNQLVVPANQREYSWTDRQVGFQLFQDFAKAISDDEPGYFLGTIVTIPRATGNLEVVDGQQRLATDRYSSCRSPRLSQRQVEPLHHRPHVGQVVGP